MRAHRRPQNSRGIWGVVFVLWICGHAFGAMIVGSNFWDVQYGTNGGSDPFATGYRNVTGDNPWKPAFLEEIRPYAALRMMDFNETNNPLREGWVSGRWADRRQKSDRIQVPMAYEWMIDLCNRVGRDLWINVVHMADDDHVRRLAQLIYNTLDPSLKCYVEYSNETWNDMFDQAAYCQQKALEVGITDPNQWYRGQKYHAYRTIQIAEIFEQVFAPARHRLVTVMGSTHVHAFAETHIECIKDRTFYNPHNVRIDALALAPYVSGRNAQELIANIHQTMVDCVFRVRNALLSSGLRDIQLIAYEGGSGIDDESANRDPRMYDFYLAYCDTMAKYFTVFMNYCHAGEGWGAKTYIGQPLSDAHKYRGLVAWIQAHPSGNTNNTVRNNTTSCATLSPHAHLLSTALSFTVTGRTLQPLPDRGRIPNLVLTNGSKTLYTNWTGLRVIPGGGGEN